MAEWQFNKCHIVTLFAMATLLAGSLVGCSSSKRDLQAEQRAGLIWMFPGVEGGPLALTEARRAFRDAGVMSKVQTHEYGRPFGLLANLMSYESNLVAAEGVAGQIAEYRIKHPQAPIDLVGYSGGGAMAIMVAEALPADVRLRNVVLCQAAISQNYNLSKTLRHTDGKLVNLHATNDWLMLGIGTSVFGTMDRQYESAAGKDGFVLPLVLDDPALAEHFEQHKWTPDMILIGHGGMHAGILTYGWNRNTVAPWLVPETCRCACACCRRPSDDQAESTP
ncbi:MAG: hypothetical protein GXP29_07585 [Planctomycetes bacterium]|nr:hypothetical protein [Planctomycetota bacterium]